MASFYDRLSPYYERLTHYFEGPARIMGLAMLAPAAGERMLEIGPGSGGMLPRLAEAVGPKGAAHALDLSAGMLTACQRQQRASPHGSRIHLCRGDGCHLPYATASFDGLYLSFTLELFSANSMPRLLAECRRVLRPSGRLVAVTLHRPEPPPLSVRLYTSLHRRWPHFLDCRPIHTATLLTVAGFRPVQEQTTSVGGLPVAIVMARRD